VAAFDDGDKGTTHSIQQVYISNDVSGRLEKASHHPTTPHHPQPGNHSRSPLGVRGLAVASFTSAADERVSNRHTADRTEKNTEEKEPSANKPRPAWTLGRHLRSKVPTCPSRRAVKT
jgi:hypothetical protein